MGIQFYRNVLQYLKVYALKVRSVWRYGGNQRNFDCFVPAVSTLRTLHGLNFCCNKI